jgi:hypothetical protein
VHKACSSLVRMTRLEKSHLFSLVSGGAKAQNSNFTGILHL